MEKAENFSILEEKKEHSIKSKVTRNKNNNNNNDIKKDASQIRM